MKFLKLEISNLASLDRPGGETIDFEHGVLGDSTIFSIVGPTGSGKSTLLDAICLALYGRAPRYPLKKGDRNRGIKIYGQADESESSRLAPTDPRNILTRGKKEGHSKLTFLANNGTVYRAEWHVKFNRKKFDTAGTYLYKLVSKNGTVGEEWAEWDELPSIIGLDFDQFLRTVLIAQGSFASFIKADENDRYELLEKLIGCASLYSTIALNIKQKASEADQAYDSLATTFAARESELIKPQEELDRVTGRIQQLEEEARQVKIELDQVNASLGWYAQDRKYVGNIGLYRKELDTARQQLADFQGNSDRLRLHDTTLPAVDCYKDILKARENIRVQDEELKELGDKVEAQKKAIAEENARLDELGAALEKARKDLEEQLPRINRARTIKGELETATKALAEKEKARNEAGTALSKARVEVQKNTRAISKAEKDLEKARTDYDAMKTAVDGARKINEEAETLAKTAFEAKEKEAEGLDAKTLQEASAKALQKKNDILKAIGLRESAVRKTADLEKLGQEMAQLRGRNGEIDGILSVLKPEALQTELDKQREKRTLMTSEDWRKHRRLLADGDPCPLCGAVHHPFETDAALVPLLDSFDELIAGIERQIQECGRLSDERGRNEATLDAKSAVAGGLKSELDHLSVEWAGIRATYPDWPEEVDALRGVQAHIDREADEAGQALADYNTLVEKIGKLRKEKEAAENASRRYKEHSDRELAKADGLRVSADTALQTEKGKTGNLETQVKEKSEALESAAEALRKAMEEVEEKTTSVRSEIGDNDPDVLEEKLKAVLKNAEEAVNTRKETVVRLTNEQKGLEGQVSTTTRNRETETRRMEQKSGELAGWLEEYNRVPENRKKLTVDGIAAIHGMADDWEGIRGKQRKLIAGVTSANTTFENECSAREEHQKQKPERTEEELEARKNELDAVSQDELVNLKARKQLHDNAVAALGDTLPKKQEAEQLRDEWKEITEAIGGDGKTLRKIAQCYTLRFLIEHANDEIRKFNTRYELQQVKNSLGIRVIDHDRADDVRDTTSLSGGETFIVSLGLALGLSSLSSRNISFGNLFIDEGFGTLDPDTLATVLNSLAMLQTSQGKKVGIISHTDTMSECITTQIRVIKDGNSGSSHIDLYP